VPSEDVSVIIWDSVEWLPRLAQGETFLPVHVVRMELNFFHFHMYSMHPGSVARILVSLNWMW